MADHIIKTVIDFFVGKMESIIAVADPSSAVSNSRFPDQLIVKSSGTFTGTAAKTYRVAISTAGISGVAKCTITDITDGSDTVATPQTITSGSAINLGLKGAKITFTFPTVDAMTLADSWDIKCGPYHNTMKTVSKVRANAMELKDFPACVIGATSVNYNEPDGARYLIAAMITCDCWLNERDNITDEMLEMLADMEKAGQYDPHCGGVAIDTQIRRAELVVPYEDQPLGLVSMDFEVRFASVIQ